MALSSAGAERFDAIDAAVEKSIAAGEMPGCVVLVVHKDGVKYRKAFGLRAKQPKEAKMTPDVVFDLASLTKPVATATCVWKLIEDGTIKLDDPVAKHWPEFAANGKDKITIEQCLLHTSGLIADNPLTDYEGGKLKALEQVAGLKPEAPAGARFKYSDVGYIVLGEVVERVTGKPLDIITARYVLEPLGVGASHFWTPLAREVHASPLVDRIAPTTYEDGVWLTGVVHDPRSRKMSGVAGHAGLFGNADDLARYCRMILHNGELDGKRILKAETVKLMTEPVKVPGGLRTRGWDCDTAYSKNRGEVFPKGKSFGHTGFTGTSIWIDPGSQTAVIFLSNRLHPDGKGNVTKIRGEVATLAARALGLYND